jgi:hypothetical protein
MIMRRGESYTTLSANKKCTKKIILKPTNCILLYVTCTDKPKTISAV